MEPTYAIIRFYADRDKPREYIASGLTREEAEDHCSDPDTSGDGWFDGFQEE